MKIAVITCAAYRDCWPIFFKLLDKFWPNHPPATIVTDQYDGSWTHSKVWSESPDPAWTKVLQHYAEEQTDTVLLFQEDFFLTEPVREDLIVMALEQMHQRQAGCVRLFSCPGGTQEYGHSHFQIVERGTEYRMSCQASIWEPQYLANICRNCGGPSPADFEIGGSSYSGQLSAEVLSYRRELKPWPLDYVCSGVSRGRWNPEMRRVSERHNLNMDFSQRGFAPA